MLNARADAGRDAGPDREHVPQEERRAVLVLSGVSGVPAGAMLDMADRLRQAMRAIGIADVRIEVRTQDDAPTP